MEPIQSRQNELVKRFIALGTDPKARQEAGEYLCAGQTPLTEAMASGAEAAFGSGAAQSAAAVTAAKTERARNDARIQNFFLIGASKTTFSELSPPERAIIQKLPAPAGETALL